MPGIVAAARHDAAMAAGVRFCASGVQALQLPDGRGG
jgi:hypothetical protein